MIFIIKKGKEKRESFGARTGEEEGRACVFRVQRARDPCRSDNSALFLFSIHLFIDENRNKDLRRDNGG